MKTGINKHDYRRMQEQWDSLERRLEAVAQITIEVEKIILSPNAFPVVKRDAEQRMVLLQQRKALLTEQQSDVEEWLVVNQAPGWVAT